MRTITEWFDLYGRDHQNPVNKAIHWVCIPAIVFATLGLLAAIPVGTPWLNVGTAVAGLALVFYLSLSATIAVGMAVVAGACLLALGAMASAGLPVGWISAAIFVVAWIFQFVGHKIEGQKPSFFEDLQFLLIGPAWLLGFLYRKAGVPVETWRRPASA